VGGPPLGAEDLGPKETGAAPVEEDVGASDETWGGGAAPLVPQPVMGLLPGKMLRRPSMISGTDDWMLQEVDGSLMPPIKPGHLSMPESPASQLSIICCKVGTSHPAICWTHQLVIIIR
jgi:hypothetical protein